MRGEGNTLFGIDFSRNCIGNIVALLRNPEFRFGLRARLGDGGPGRCGSCRGRGILVRRGPHPLPVPEMEWPRFSNKLNLVNYITSCIKQNITDYYA